MKKSRPSPENFENGIERLEQIVLLMEKNEIPLEQALTLFQEGIELIKSCNKSLDVAEEKIQVLLEDTNGEFKLTTMEKDKE
ncbi:MAG: exodeoxyribonuclease VII small subunit [Eubacteriales bacterium]